MGLFNKAKNAIKKIGSGIEKTVNKVVSEIKKPIEKATDWVGQLTNNATGITSSARQQNEYNTQLQNSAQEFNAIEAEKERKWQEEMSNTARQRAVSDAQIAGINPVLAAGGTSAGATSAAGATASSPGGSTGAGTGINPIEMITGMINALTNSARTQSEIKKNENEIDNNTKRTNATVKNLETNTTKQKYETTKIDKDTAYGGKTANTVKTWRKAIFGD